MDTTMFPESKVHGANMGPTWVLSAPDGPQVDPMNLAIRVIAYNWQVVSSPISVVQNPLLIHVQNVGLFQL